MGREAAPRLAGDDYQHLIGWYYLLELLLGGRELQSVTVEDAEAGSADDVTLRYAAASQQPDTFLQVKYHVDHRDEYSAEALVAAAGNERSLLQKLHATWRRLTARGRPVEIHLVSNWTWKGGDPLRRCTRGEDGTLSESFLTASPGSRIGRARELWRRHLDIDGDELESFARTLRFRLAFATIQDLKTWTADRMRSVGLRDDPAALLIAAGLVRQLVREGRRDLGRPDVERLVDRHGLRLPAGEEPAVTVYLTTIQARRYDLPPDHLLDWRHHFAGGGHRKGHAVVDPAAWNEKMLPELLDLERRIATTTPVRLIRARGQARLSPWLAFGHTFSEVAGYTIEVDQQGRLWSTDAAPSRLRVIETRRTAFPAGDPATVAAGISVTGSLEKAVEDHLKEAGTAAAALFLEPNRTLGPDCLRSPGDVAALARGAKSRLRAFVAEHAARRLLLFYFGPLSGACFLGHRLNAVAPEILVMEHLEPGYAPAFLLR